MYSIICKRCGNYFTARSRGATYCPDCVTAVKSDAYKAKMLELNRPLTPDTEYLMCVYKHRGDSVKRIAIDLKRSEASIRKILKSAKDSGRYDKHINRYNKCTSSFYSSVFTANGVKINENTKVE